MLNTNMGFNEYISAEVHSNLAPPYPGAGGQAGGPSLHCPPAPHRRARNSFWCMPLQEEYLAGLLHAEAGAKGHLARVLAAMQAKYKYLLELTSESQIYYRQTVLQNAGEAAALFIEGLVLDKKTQKHWGCCPQGECQRQTASPRCRRCHPASRRHCGARSRRCLLKTRLGTRSGAGSSVSMARTSARKVEALP